MFHDGDARRALVVEPPRQPCLAKLADVGPGGGAGAPRANVVDVDVAALLASLVGFGGGAPNGEF